MKETPAVEIFVRFDEAELSLSPPKGYSLSDAHQGGSVGCIQVKKTIALTEKYYKYTIPMNSVGFGGKITRP